MSPPAGRKLDLRSPTEVLTIFAAKGQTGVRLTHYAEVRVRTSYLIGEEKAKTGRRG